MPDRGQALTEAQLALDVRVRRQLDPTFARLYEGARRDVEEWLWVASPDDGAYGLLAFSGLRTAEEQLQEFREGQSSFDGLERRSYHQPQLVAGVEVGGARACDTVLVRDGVSLWDPLAADGFAGEVYQRLGAAGERRGLTWGGRWSGLRDVYHLDYRGVPA